MSIAVRIALALVSSAALTVMLHHGFSAMYRPHALVERSRRDSTHPYKAYIALVLCGWAYAGYQAGVAFFGWLPAGVVWSDDGTYFNHFAFYLGFAAVFVPIAFEALAQEKVRVARLESEIKALWAERRRIEALEYEPIEALARAPIEEESQVERLRVKWNSAQGTADKQCAERVLRVAEAQVARAREVKRRLLQAQEEAERDAAVSREEIAKTRARERDREVFQAQLPRAMAEYVVRTHRPMLLDLTALEADRSEQLLDGQFASSRWAVLHAAAKATMSVTQLDIERGASAPYDLDALLEATVATQLSANARLYAYYSEATLSGSGRVSPLIRVSDGSTRVVGALLTGEERPWVDVLRFQSSIEGLIEAFFMAHALSRYGAYPHGWYERDHRITFLANPTQLYGFFAKALVSEADMAWVRTFDTPCGFRVSAQNEALTLSCLATSPTSGLSDFETALENGIVVRTARTPLGPQALVLY